MMTKMIDNEHLEQAKKFCEIYNIPEWYELNRKGKFFATCKMMPTDHERAIADRIVREGLFEWYAVFMDCYFAVGKNNVGQADIIAANRNGVFVFESKDYAGWIFGNGAINKWTYIKYRNKYYFYNPIKQNDSHVNALRRVLGMDLKYYSIVVFGNEATIKKVENVPNDVCLIEDKKLINILRDIIDVEVDCLTDDEVLEVCRKINSARLPRSDKMVVEHIKKTHSYYSWK